MKKWYSNYIGLPREIYVLCLATLINRLGDFVVPFLSLYLTQKIGMSTWASGIIITLATIICIPASLIGGKVADRYGRRKLYLFAQSISALFLIPCAFTRNPGITVVCLIISTFFNGFIRPAFKSMITDILPASQRQAGHSLNYLAINVGVAVGPIIAGIMFNHLLPMLFITDAITSILAVSLIRKNVKETYIVGEKTEVEHKAELEEKGNIFQLFYKRPYLTLFFLLQIVYSFTYSQHKFALPITLNNIFVNQGAKMLGYMASFNAITVLLVTAYISTATKKNHQLTNMTFAGIFYAIGFGMLGFVNNVGLLALSTFLWTLGEILHSINAGVYIANNSPSNYRARLNAIYEIVSSVGISLSTIFSGFYIEKFGSKSIWTIVFIVAFVASLFMFGLKQYTNRGIHNLVGVEKVNNSTS